MVFVVLAPLAGWIISRREVRRSAEARMLVRLAKTGSAAELADADEELDRMTEWLLAKLAAGDVERSQFQRVVSVIAQLRISIAQLPDVCRRTALGPQRRWPRLV